MIQVSRGHLIEYQSYMAIVCRRQRSLGQWHVHVSLIIWVVLPQLVSELIQWICYNITLENFKRILQLKVFERN